MHLQQALTGVNFHVFSLGNRACPTATWNYPCVLSIGAIPKTRSATHKCKRQSSESPESIESNIPHVRTVNRVFSG